MVPEVRTAHDQLSRSHAALGAQADAAPPAPDVVVAGFSQDEILSLAYALERAAPVGAGIDDSTLKGVKARVDELEAKARRARSLMIGGGALVLLGAILSVVGSPVLGGVAVVGVVLIVAAAMKTKSSDLAAARKEHAALVVRVAAANETSDQFTRERAQAEERCGELGVPADAARLRALASDISRAETFAERSRQFEERTAVSRLTAPQRMLLSVRRSRPGR